MSDEFCELQWIGEGSGRTGTTEFVAAVETFQSGDRNCRRKTRLRTFTGQEETTAWADPLTVIRRELAARGNGAVNVGMEEQVLSPEYPGC